MQGAMVQNAIFLIYHKLSILSNVIKRKYFFYQTRFITNNYFYQT